MRSLIAAGSAATTTGVEPRGFVHISGDVVHTRGCEVNTVLRREEKHAHRDSPAARIVAWDDDGSGGLLVTTTTEHLAHRLGRALEKHLGGDAHHGFSAGNKLALVWWQG